MQKLTIFLICAWAPFGINRVFGDPGINSGFDDTAIDRTVDPCSDFYQFACGNWIARTPLPTDRALPFVSRAMSPMQEHVDEAVHKILFEISASNRQNLSSEQQKLRDFYLTCMDEKQAEEPSLGDLKEELQTIDSIHDLGSLSQELAYLQLQGISVLFELLDFPDFFHASQILPTLYQAQLVLGAKDYYLNSDPKSADLREHYLNHIAKLFELSGKPTSKVTELAHTVLTIETQLAQTSISGNLSNASAEVDPRELEHTLNLQQLRLASPSIDWLEYFSTLGHPEWNTFNLTLPAYFQSLDALIKTTRIENIKEYLAFRLLEHSSQVLGKSFQSEYISFAGYLTGQTSVPPRWKSCQDATLSAMPDALGKLYVEKYFDESNRSFAEKIIENIENIFEKELQTVTWLDQPTRQSALRKLHKIVNNVGYQDHWKSYDQLQIATQSDLVNRQNARIEQTRQKLSTIGQPRDRSEWLMNPTFVDAYYDPSLNKMAFPAGILQAPIFSKDTTIAGNYAGIGMVMGHELTHGFDNHGHLYDQDGSVSDWWSKGVSDEFEHRSSCLVDQYSAYSQEDGLHLNGKNTLGENIADNGGIKLAYQAYRRLLEHGTAVPVVNGFTSDQQFFISYGQLWCSKTTPEFERFLITMDVHALPKFRVTGPLSNMPWFQEAFQCKINDSMVPKQRCEVW